MLTTKQCAVEWRITKMKYISLPYTVPPFLGFPSANLRKDMRFPRTCNNFLFGYWRLFQLPVHASHFYRGLWKRHNLSQPIKLCVALQHQFCNFPWISRINRSELSTRILLACTMQRCNSCLGAGLSDLNSISGFVITEFLHISSAGWTCFHQKSDNAIFKIFQYSTLRCNLNKLLPLTVQTYMSIQSRSSISIKPWAWGI